MATSAQIIKYLSKEVNADPNYNLKQLYDKYIRLCKDNGVNPECKDIHSIALMCNYQEGWVWYKCKDLEIEYHALDEYKT